MINSGYYRSVVAALKYGVFPRPSLRRDTPRFSIAFFRFFVNVNRENPKSGRFFIQNP